VTDPREALAELSGAGVSRWIHPILQFPLDPVILVEGEYDAVFLEEAFKVVVPKRTVRIADVSRLEGTSGKSGIDRLRDYIKGSESAIKARQSDAPVVVLLDWDARSRQSGFKDLVSNSGGAVYHVLAWPDDALNKNLGKSFKGIERAYPDRIIKTAVAQGKSIGKNKAGMYMVQPDEYGEIKAALSKIVRAGLTKEDLAHCDSFLQQILATAGAR
jgi:5S rRNA maturation endonuclease (ribonuclease M5)